MAQFEKMQMMDERDCLTLYANPGDCTMRKTPVFVMSVKEVQEASPDQLPHVQFGPQVE